MDNTERPPLWEAVAVCIPAQNRQSQGGLLRRRVIASVIRAVAQYLQAHGLVSTAGTKATPGSDARLLEALETEARRAETGK